MPPRPITDDRFRAVRAAAGEDNYLPDYAMGGLLMQQCLKELTDVRLLVVRHDADAALQ